MTLAAYRAIFALPSFRRFWIGFTVSALGDALTGVALTWYVYELTGSAGALGLLLICFTGPIILGGLLAGWLLDRFDRRTVMLIDNLVRGVAMALVPLLHAVGLLALWHIYAVAAVYGLLMMIALAGGPAIIPSLVPPEQLATANALEMLSFTLAGVAGPVIAGALIGVIGAPAVVGLDALSYGVFALLLLGVRIAPAPAGEDQTRYTLGDAVRLLLTEPILSSTTLMFLIFNIGGGMLTVALPILVDRVFGGGPQLYGVLLGVRATGEVVSSLLAGGLTLRLAIGARICIAQVCSGLALALVAFAPLLGIVALGLALFGVCSAPLTIWAQTLRMRIIPAALRGRAFALLRMLMQSGNPLGGALAGAILPLIGATPLLGLAALLAGLPGLAGTLIRPLRTAGGEGRTDVALEHR